VLVDLPYLVRDRDRHGNLRIYVRKKRALRKIRLHAPEGSGAFFEEYAAAIAKMAEKPAHGRKSFAWLTERYYESAEFRQLTGRTQGVRRSILDGFNAEHGHKPFDLMESSHVRQFRNEKADKPEAANALVKAIRQVFAVGLEAGDCRRNPARDVPYLKSKNPDGFHTWTVEEVVQYLDYHGAFSRAGRALGVLLFTGAARVDVVKFGRQHIKNRPKVDDPSQRESRLQYRRDKTSVPIDIPVLPELKAIIEATSVGDLTFIVTAFDRAFTPDGFGNRFRKWCNDAGLPHCTAHGLRKAGSTIAANNGATAHQLMSIFGWETIKQAERYTKKANRARLADGGINTLSDGQIRNLYCPTEGPTGVPPEISDCSVNENKDDGAQGRNRTTDTRIFSPLLYQLSYLGP